MNILFFKNNCIFMFIVIIATFYAYSPKTIPIGYLIHYNLKINFSNNKIYYQNYLSFHQNFNYL